MTALETLPKAIQYARSKIYNDRYFRTDLQRGTAQKIFAFLEKSIESGRIIEWRDGYGSSTLLLGSFLSVMLRTGWSRNGALEGAREAHTNFTARFGPERPRPDGLMFLFALVAFMADKHPHDPQYGLVEISEILEQVLAVRMGTNEPRDAGLCACVLILEGLVKDTKE